MVISDNWLEYKAIGVHLLCAINKLAAVEVNIQ